MWKSCRVTVVVGFPRGVLRPKTRGAAGPEGVRPRDFPGGSIRHCAQYSGTVHVCAAQWYSTRACSTVVHYLCVHYSGTAPVCAVQWYRTSVGSTVIQHLCVQNSGAAHVCAVQ